MTQSTTVFSQTFLDESICSHPEARRRRHRSASPAGSPRCAQAAGALHPRRRRLGRPCGPRRQRLPQDLRLRGVHAHRQRQRAHARMNDEGWDTWFSEWLKARVCAQGRRAPGVLGRRRQPREERLASTWSARSSSPRKSGPRSSASSAATAATRSRSPTRACVIPTVSPDASRPTPRGSAPWSGTCS